MNERIDFREELKHIERLLGKEEYTAGARECVIVIEQALQYVLHRNLEQVDEGVRAKVQNAVRKRDRRGQGIKGLTMGQLSNVLQESKFLEAWAQASGTDLTRARLIDLDEVRKLRNKFMHEARKASRSEATFLSECLRVILEDFGLVSREEVKRLDSIGGEWTKPVLQHVEAPGQLGMKLEKSDFQALTQLVQNLPEFGMERERRRLVAGALEGEPNADAMLARLDLGGSPMGAAIEIVRFLQGFGQVADGKQVLGVFLNSLKPYLGGEQAEFIDTLFTQYPLDASLITDRPIDQWRGEDSAEAIKEKIIGENTLRHINMLELALEAAKAVVHLRVINENGQEAFGTGFMITTDLLMTNHHVIATPREATATEYTFNYQLGIDGKMLDVAPAQAMDDGVFYTNPELDYTILQLANEPGQEFGYVCLKSVRANKDDRVAIIQHPGGHFKQISMQNNFVAYADTRVVQYTTSTLPGSSGAPVFDDHFEVIAIHHSGGQLKDPGTGRYELRNEGTSACAMLEDLQHHAPQIHRLLGDF